MVRVARDQEQLRTARISLASALGAAVLVLLIWTLMKEPPLPVAEQRTLSTYPVLWVCEKDPRHRFTARGRFESLPCRQCEGRCYIQLRYICLQCEEEFDVFVKFERLSAEGEALSGRPGERVSQYRYDSRSPWQECDGHVPCPVAGCPGPTRRPSTSWSEHVRD